MTKIKTNRPDALTQEHSHACEKERVIEGQTETGINVDIVQSCLDYHEKVIHDYLNNGATHDSRTAAHHALV